MIAKKRLLPILVAVLMVFAMMPITAGTVFASESNDPVVGLPGVLETGANTDKAQTVYYGVNGKNPVAWRVIKYKNTGNSYIENQDGSMTLFAAGNLTSDVQFATNGKNEYAGSELKSVVDGLYGSESGSLFTDQEKNAIQERTLSVGEYSFNSPYSTGVSITETSRYLWPLSTAEALTLPSDFRSASGFWWLRSPGASDDFAAYVDRVGLVEHLGTRVDAKNGVRPAFNLNLESVLFTSAAEGGKSSGAEGADALKKISTTSTNEWKLTLHDSSRDVVQYSARTDAVLSATEGYDSWSVSIIGKSDEHATLPMPKENEYVSAILTDSNDKALYYGNIANSNMVGWGTVSIPKGLAAGKYKLHIFSEEINDDKFTDYASAFSTIDLTVDAPPVETFTVTFKAAGGTWTDGTTTDKEVTVEKGSAATAPADPTREGFTFDGWDTDYSNVTSNLTVTAQWKENSEPQPQPAAQTITASNVTKTYGNVAFSLGAKTSGDGTLTYKSSNTKVVTVDSAGKVTIKGAGTAKITISVSATANYKAATKTITVTVKQAANPLKIGAKTASVKYSKLKKKTQALAVTKVIGFTNDIGDSKTYTLSSAKKDKKSFKKYFRINKTTGKVTIKKNKKMKKGTYKVKVKVKANGNANYKASAWKTVTFKVEVK